MFFFSQKSRHPRAARRRPPERHDGRIHHHHSKPASGPSKKRPRTEINEEDLRRSGRIRNLPAPIYTTFERDEDLGDKSGSRYVYFIQLGN